jgi:hypothetical protein
MALLRARHLILWAYAAYLFADRAFSPGGDWHYFTQASDLLFGRHTRGFDQPGGLHLFANYPELHMGPLSVVLAGFFRLLPGDGRLAAEAAMCALGPVAVLLLERAARRVRPTADPLLQFATLAGGLVFLRAWIETAGPIAHLDDVVVLGGAAVAAYAVAARRPYLAAAAIGLAVAGKTWAVLLLPLLACFPRREAVRATAFAGALSAVAWLPFVLADRATIGALGVNQANDAASGLRALGIHTAMTPHWLRPLQIGLGLALALVAVARGRWALALLVAVAARLALDPATFPYYTPGLVLAALVFDLLGPRRPLPLATLGAFVALQTVPAFASPHTQGLVRVGVLLAACALLAAPRRAPALAPATSPAG